MDTLQLDVPALVHDLRSPLNGIDGHAQLGKTMIDKLDISDEAKEKLTSHFSIIRMLVGDAVKLNEDLYDHLRTPDIMTDFTKSMCDIRQLIVDTILKLSPLVIMKNLKVVIPKISEVRTLANFDVDKIRRVIVNLLTNAIKFADDGTTIDIDFSDVEITTTGICVAISNTGKAIDNNELTRIFDPYYQSDAAMRGNGLGLSISKKIVEGHGGKIWAESNEGRATFSFYLPKE